MTDDGQHHDQHPDDGDTCPDTSGHPPYRPGGYVRTTPVDLPPGTPIVRLASTDTVQTRPDTDTPGTEDRRPDGVRIEYRARVPRRQLGAALTEALTVIARETGHDGTRGETAP